MPRRLQCAVAWCYGRRRRWWLQRKKIPKFGTLPSLERHVRNLSYYFILIYRELSHVAKCDRTIITVLSQAPRLATNLLASMHGIESSFETNLLTGANKRCGKCDRIRMACWGYSILVLRIKARPRKEIIIPNCMFPKPRDWRTLFFLCKRVTSFTCRPYRPGPLLAAYETPHLWNELPANSEHVNSFHKLDNRTALWALFSS